MATMIEPFLSSALRDAPAYTPAVALVGPRDTGKTTLALAATGDAIDLDLELERDRARLDPAAIHLSDHLDKLVIPDEGRPAPGLFPVSRGLIDCSRRAGRAAKLAGTASSTGASRREQ
jgi:hypothetical protein